MPDRSGPSGVVERTFQITGATGPVLGVAWLPAKEPKAAEPKAAEPETAGSEAARLVLLGHGGSGHKRSPRNVELGTWFAANGLAAAAIDGPYHGDRVRAPIPAKEYQERMVAEGVDAVLDRMTADWLAVVRMLGAERVAYVGLSL
ncbi:MAG: hypothetical protein HOV77_32510, partial [Hamadaea sp.]|nr:hypothetical protein [Hamadaea sp.]